MLSLTWEITGKVFVFEGPDGAGKTTAIEQVAHQLKSKGYLPKICRSPGSTELGEYLRDFLKQDRQEPISKKSEMYLQFANHHQLFDEVIYAHRDHPDYDRMIFLIDRLDLSTIVYQSTNNNDVIQYNSVVRQLQRFFYQNIQSVPTYFIITADESTLQHRLQQKNDQMDRYESDSDDEKKRIIQTYQDIIDINEQRQDAPIHHIDGDRDIDSICAVIVKTIDETYQITFSLSFQQSTSESQQGK